MSATVCSHVSYNNYEFHIQGIRQGSYTIDSSCLLKWRFFRPLHASLVSVTDLKKKVIMWWQITRSCDEWISCCRGKMLHSLFALQICWVLNFLARYKSRYVTEDSTTDAESTVWTRFPSNSILLRNLQQTVKSFFVIMWTIF